jgi:hypothetical protein
MACARYACRNGSIGSRRHPPASPAEPWAVESAVLLGLALLAISCEDSHLKTAPVIVSVASTVTDLVEGF